MMSIFPAFSSRNLRLPGKHLEASLRHGTFMLVFTSGIALFLTQKVTNSSLLLLGITVAAWLLARRPIGGTFWEIASFCYLIFLPFDAFRLSGSLAPALVHLFIFIIVNKIFNLQNERDYYQVYLLTFLSILAASSLSVEIEMFYVILAYIILLIWNICSITLLREWKAAAVPDPFPFSLFGFRYWFVIILASFFTFLIAIGIFFILPRIQLGFLGNIHVGKLQHVSGFSSKVEIGEISNVEEDPQVAMRIRVTSTKPLDGHRFYWRGMAFDHYDGKSWSVAIPGTRFLYQDSENYFYNAYSPEQEEILVKQEFYLAPLDTRVIFGMDRILRLNGNFVAITRDNNGTLTAMNRAENYVVFSRPAGFSPKRPSTRELFVPENVKRYYLQLPFRSQRIDSLALRIVSGANTPQTQIQALQEYFEKEYEYTTENLPQHESDPLSLFLFERKAGHCQYFATAMTILLRHLGIPARVVNGFLQGEFNEIGRFYAVRHSDAHSWVEAYLDGSWVLVDPSPRVLPGEKISWFGWLKPRKFAQSVAFFWDRYILIYSATDQLETLNSMREKYKEIRKNVKEPGILVSNRFVTSLKQSWHFYRYLLVSFLIVLLVMIFIVRLYFRRRRRKQIIRTPVLFYQEMLSILERKGFTRPPQFTPAEFIENVSEEIPPEYVVELSFLTDLFYHCRFGKYPVPPSEQVKVRASLQRLQHL